MLEKQELEKMHSGGGGEVEQLKKELAEKTEQYDRLSQASKEQIERLTIEVASMNPQLNLALFVLIFVTFYQRVVMKRGSSLKKKRRGHPSRW
mgnify:CR=1 FL=1